MSRKSKWLSGKTKMIRVPIAIAPCILEMAKLIDKGYSGHKYCDSEEVAEVLEDVGIHLYYEEEDKDEDARLIQSEDARQRGLGLCPSRAICGAVAEGTSFASSFRTGSGEDPPAPCTHLAGGDLTADQERSLSSMKEFLQCGEDTYYRLSGYAGTGKSYLVVQLMNYLNLSRCSFIAASPTNKAVKNLKKLAAEANVSIEAKTIAQLLGQQPELNQETGKEEFVSKIDCNISDYRVVIIDEFSMISSNNFRDINRAVRGGRTQVIFVGDEAQLPPVNEKEPIVAVSHEIDHSSSLSTVVRYDGDIARVAEEIRSEPDYAHFSYPFKTTDDGTIICLPRNEWLETAMTHFTSSEYSANPDHVRFLVWRNNTAAALNDYVRSRLWGLEAPPYVKGDRLIAKTPVFRPGVPTGKRINWVIAMNNSEECEVCGEARLVIHELSTWEYWKVPVKTDDGLVLNLQILTEEGEKLRKKEMAKYKKVKNWGEFWRLVKTFDNVPYAYAITTHKAQGSGINHVFLEVRDLLACSDKQKILYTALTRAKRSAFIPRS